MPTAASPRADAWPPKPGASANPFSPIRLGLWLLVGLAFVALVAAAALGWAWLRSLPSDGGPQASIVAPAGAVAARPADA